VKTKFYGQGFSLNRIKKDPLWKNHHLVSMEQTHQDLIHILDNENIDLTTTPQVISQVDSVITQLPQVTLLIKSADCLPISIYHPSGLIAGIHASRKNTQLKILQKTLQKITNQFGLNSDFQIYFGPHIHEQCYQIDRKKDLYYSLIKNNQDQINQILGKNNYTLDISPDCTHCHPQMHSYRVEGPGLPMNYSAISL
jgi:copper oxidase (laccase) domain-containing protein